MRDYIKWAEEEEKPLGIAGLAHFAGINRITVFRYGGGEYGPEYCVPIKEAISAIEADHERRLIAGKGSVAGVIFSLKNNFGYVDQKQIDHTGELAVGEIKRKIVHQEPAPALEGTAKRVNGHG